MTAIQACVNDIAQIDPRKDTRFGGCFMIVTEIKDSGVIGFVPGMKGEKAYVRKCWEDIQWVGSAEWP